MTWKPLFAARHNKEIAPVTVSLQATQPQAIISRSYIEDSLPATADFNEMRTRVFRNAVPDWKA